MNVQNKEYWENGKPYNDYVINELNDNRKEAWKNRIRSHFTQGCIMNVLDVGCGPGFLSCILSEEGHKVIGIDRSADMLKYACQNADNLGVKPEFLGMDANNLNFDDNTFDLIISRNVTWTFDEPESIYKQFYNKLKKGGKLLIYDANWHIPFYNSELLERVRENEKWYYETYHEEFKVYDDDTSIFENLPLSNVWRPQWDIQALKNIGFTHILYNLDVGKELYTNWEQKLYSVTPLFEISAVKI